MAKPSDTAQLDGVSIVNKGMNSGVQPRLLPVGQVSFAINATFRGGLPKTRPCYRKVPLTYSDETTQTNATTKLWQKASFYQAVGSGENCLVSSIGGRIFRYLVGSTNSVQDISIPNDLNNPINPDCWMWQGEDFLTVQNGEANPIFYDGASARRSKGYGGNELPPGCMGVYVQGRMWMALPNRTSFMAGDLVYSHGYNDGHNGRASVLKIQENSFLSGGGAFSVPVTAGKINSMSSVAIADTSLGQGPLQVLTQTSVFSVQVPYSREEWASTQFPLMTIGLPNYGALSQESVVTVNGDLWYRSFDGIRSYQIARRDFNTWVNCPQSVEVEKILNYDSQGLLNRASGVLFNNRLILTCSPYETERGVAHRGLIALDLNNISNLTSRSDPVYDGLWTGLNILQILKGTFNGQERCFAFALEENNAICLYELLEDDASYFDYDGQNDVEVESSIESRALGFNSNGNQLMYLLCGDLFIDKIAGSPEVAFDFKFRSDENPNWEDWHSFSVCAPIKNCEFTDCKPFEPPQQQYRTYIRLPDPTSKCSNQTKRLIRSGYEFQLRMAWTGYMQLNRFHMWAEARADSVVKSCPTTESCELVTGCELPWFSYSIES